MIFTVTINPAIDYVVHLDELIGGVTNRSQYEEYFFGGKGINVSAVLKELGLDSIALGFVSGFTGQALEAGLRKNGLCTDFVHAKEGITRINVKIKAKQETEINGQGTKVSENELKALEEKVAKLKDGDILVLSGSIPRLLPQDLYSRLLELAGERNVPAIVDTSGDLLMGALEYRPMLVKPNMEELRGIFGAAISAESGAQKLQEMGARNVIVSMGGDGALLLSENGEMYHAGVCRGKIQNTVGAGDSMVAGFIAGYLKTKDYQYALDLGSAAGSATALSPGLAKKDKIAQCFSALRKEG